MPSYGIVSCLFPRPSQKPVRVVHMISIPVSSSDFLIGYLFFSGQNESLASVSSSDRDRRRRERKNIARELLDTEDK